MTIAPVTDYIETAANAECFLMFATTRLGDTGRYAMIVGDLGFKVLESPMTSQTSRSSVNASYGW